MQKADAAALSSYTQSPCLYFWSQGLTFITPNPNVFYKFEE